MVHLTPGDALSNYARTCLSLAEVPQVSLSSCRPPIRQFICPHDTPKLFCDRLGYHMREKWSARCSALTNNLRDGWTHRQPCHLYCARHAHPRLLSDNSDVVVMLRCALCSNSLIVLTVLTPFRVYKKPNKTKLADPKFSCLGLAGDNSKLYRNETTNKQTNPF